MNLVGARFVTPAVVSTHFHIREGEVVADFGAGSGFFMQALSEATGATGRVYACEIQKGLVEKLSASAHAAGLSNIHPLWCDLEEMNGIKIWSDEVDVAVLINTLFMIEDKETAIAEMGRTVRKGGKFFVVDWSESFGGMGPTPEMVIAAEEVKVLFESRGFIYERDYDAGAHHYGLAFRKV